MFIRPWNRMDFGLCNRYPKEAIDSMQGITVWAGSVPLASGGVMDCPWGTELWIEVPDWLGVSDKIAVGKIAKNYVSSILTNGEDLFAHVWAGDKKAPRWLSFLGFHKEQRFRDSEGKLIDRYVLEASWE